MHCDGQIYRPPTEATTPLLQMSAGCSCNKCGFCSMYRKTKFRIVSEEDIIEDLQELASHDANTQRLFLLNGDPFVLPTEKLLRIAQLAHRFLPQLKTITCYCSIRDLHNKSFKDLVGCARQDMTSPALA